MSDYNEDKATVIDVTSQEVFDLLSKMGFIMSSQVYDKSAKYVTFIDTETGSMQFDFYFVKCKTASDVMKILYETFTAIGRNQKSADVKLLLEREKTEKRFYESEKMGKHVR